MDFLTRKNTLLVLAAILIVGLAIMAVTLRNQSRQSNEARMAPESQQMEQQDSASPEAMEEGAMEEDEDTSVMEEGLQELEEEVEPIY